MSEVRLQNLCERNPNDTQNIIERWCSEPICKRSERVPYGHQRQAPRTAGGPQKKNPKAANRAGVGAKRDPRKSKGPGGRQKASRDDERGRSASP